MSPIAAVGVRGEAVPASRAAPAASARPGAQRERFAWAVRVRWMAILGFLSLGGAAWAAGVLPDPVPCAIAAAGASLLNALNGMAVRRWRWIVAATATAVLGDVLLITFLVVQTGGVLSPFLAMYFVQVLAAAMLVEVRVALACASVALVALAVGFTTSAAALAGPGIDAGSPWFVPVWVAFFGFGLALVAYVGGYVSQQLRRREGALAQSHRQLRAATAAVERGTRELRSTAARLEQTERQLAQSEKMRALGEFVAGVAHELNNPSAIVCANLEMLESELETDQWSAQTVRALLRDCREASARAAQIVGDLRQFSRVEVHRPSRIFDVNDCVRRTVRLARHLFASRVALDLDLRPLPPVRGAPDEIDQLLLNLLGNAAQAVGDNGAVGVSTRRGGISGTDIVLRVVDDGPGVPPALAERIFEPFFTTREAGTGVGLGLSLAFAVAERHGGTLRVDTSLSPGACFELVIPSSAD